MVAIEIQISSAPGSAHADSQRSTVWGLADRFLIQFEAACIGRRLLLCRLSPTLPRPEGVLR
jgi:hypothetical protein